MAETVYPYDHGRYPVTLGIPPELAYLEDRIYSSLSHRADWPARFMAVARPDTRFSGVVQRFKLVLLQRVRDEQKKSKYHRAEFVLLCIDETLEHLRIVHAKEHDDQVRQQVTDEMVVAMTEAMASQMPELRSCAWSAAWALQACAAVWSASLVARFCNASSVRSVGPQDEEKICLREWDFYGKTLLKLLEAA
jgi:hypothetical protein